MNEGLWMVELRLDPRQLAYRSRRLPSHHEDTGYEVHSLLAAVFGEGVVQPFRVQASGRNRNGPWVKILGYTRVPVEKLSSHATDFADPADHAACDWNRLEAKEMPVEWTTGRRLGFELRSCPIVRLASEREIRSPSGEVERFAARSEVDAWLHSNFLSTTHSETATREDEDGQATRSGREEVYVKWLQDRLGPAAHLISGHLHAFRRIRIVRTDHAPVRKTRVAERPDALLRGELEVDDPAAFTELLARGVGRHRAYGFGMLLLRPPA